MKRFHRFVLSPWFLPCWLPVGAIAYASIVYLLALLDIL